MIESQMPTETQETAWRRLYRWLNAWAEVIEFDLSEVQERRISSLEAEMAALRKQAESKCGSDASPSANLNT